MRQSSTTISVLFAGSIALGGCGSGGGGSSGLSASMASMQGSTSSGAAPIVSGSAAPTPTPSISPSPSPGAMPAPTPLPLPSGRVGGPRAEGIDVSVYQGTIDWANVKAAGISFAIARASDGHFQDRTFARNWDEMKKQGLARSAYQFFRPGLDAVSQANELAAKIGPLAPGDLPPTLDVEVLDGVAPSRVVAQIATWTAEIEKKLSCHPMIYISPGFSSSLGSPRQFGLDDLWVAHWGVSAPSVPASWHDYTFWQYADNGRVAGISGAVDLDRFHGTAKDLDAFAGRAASDFVRGIASDGSGKGLWAATLEGGVLAFGEAQFRGTASGRVYPEPMLGIVATPSGGGYWLVGADGCVHAFGDAAQLGQLTGKKLASPIVAMSATPSGKGYVLVERDGDVHSFGDAQVYGQKRVKDVVGISTTPSGKGYFVATADGGVLGFGDAVVVGNALGRIGSPIVAIARTPSGKGYFLALADGQVQSFGDAPPIGYLGKRKTSAPFLGIATTDTGKGCWVVAGDGTILEMGDAHAAPARAR